MKIKGQNARALINGSCVAASTSCSVHIGVEIQQEDTKDTGDWQANRSVRKSWDASVDALVAEHGDEYYEIELDEDQPTQIELHAGDTIVVTDPNGAAIIYDEDMEEVLVSGKNYAVYTADADITVVPWIAGEDEGTVYADVYESATGLIALIEALETEKDIDFVFGLTTGDQNRELDEELLGGKALITDLSVTATNRQFVTMSMQLSGDGELSTPE